MSERWERELRKLGGLDIDEAPIHDRVRVGPSTPQYPRRPRLTAGLVAGAVGLAAIALLWQARPGDRREVGQAPELPTLAMTFRSNGTIGDTTTDEDPVRRVDTTISYGDATERSFTSTSPADAGLDPVAADDLTPFVPGPTAGSAVRIDADGDDPRILIGTPGDWPSLDRFTRIDELPSEAGMYVLVFEADYPEGVARTARRVGIVDAGTVQLTATEGKGLDAATAAAFVDGWRTDGFLSTSWYTVSDLGGQSEPRRPRPEAFESTPPIRVESGAFLRLAAPAAEARVGVFDSYGDFDPDQRLPIDILSLDSSIEGALGPKVLAFDVTWRHGKTGWGQDGSEERALFFFPVEIVESDVAPELPVQPPLPTPAPTSSGSVVVDIRRSSPERGDPEAIARLNGQEQWMCPDGWSLVNPDGTTDARIFDCGQNNLFEAPPGTPITVSGDFATVNVSTRLSGDESTGAPTGEFADVPAGTMVTYAYDVTWEDGSEASFWLLVTVAGGHAPVPGRDPSIVVRLHGLGERSSEMPTATYSFDGQTETACTESWEWRTGDGETAGGEAFCSGGPEIVVPPGTLIAIEAATVTRVTTTRTTTPFFEGDAGLVVSAEWPDGNATFRLTLTVSSDAPDLQLVVLDCPPNVQVEFADESDVRLLPGGSLYITANLPGFERDDVVEQMTRKVNGESEWSGIWQVVRDGQVVASIDWDSLSGTACRGSGIGGT